MSKSNDYLKAIGANKPFKNPNKSGKSVPAFKPGTKPAPTKKR